MDSLVKQRLVGALILIALAVVFWPIIFVVDEEPAEGTVVVVPPAPPVDRTPLVEPDTAGLRTLGDPAARSEPVPDVLPSDLMLTDASGDAYEAGSDSDTEASAPAVRDENLAPAGLPGLPDSDEVLPARSLESVSEELVEPELDSDGLPIAFSLQVATMGDRTRAEKLRNELVDAGYKGYVKRLRRDDKTLYRVLVGPKFQRDDLEAVKAAVDQTWRVDSLIIRYLP